MSYVPEHGDTFHCVVCIESWRYPNWEPDTAPVLWQDPEYILPPGKEHKNTCICETLKNMGFSKPRKELPRAHDPTVEGVGAVPYKITKNVEVILAEGPPIASYPRGHYVVGLRTMFGVTQLSFFDAWAEHYPNHVKPTHVLVWTPHSQHIFKWSAVKYFYKGA